MQKYMFDSNAVSSLLRSGLDLQSFFVNHKNDCEFFITHIQIEELKKIPSLDLRSLHINCIEQMEPETVGYLGVVGHAKLGQCVVGGSENKFDYLINKTKSNFNDAMIGDAAFREKCILVTDDKKFIKKLHENEIETVTFLEFCEIVGQGL